MIRPYIVNLKIELVDCTLTVRYTDDPERGEVGATVEFTEVGNVQVDRYHDADDHTYGDFNPIRRVAVSLGRSRFKINTGDAVLAFEASSTVRFKYATADGSDWPAFFAVDSGVAE